MIIEFYGLPGTGKTTMAKGIEAAGAFKIVKISSRGELLWLNFLFLIKHPIKSTANLFYILINSTDWKMFYYKFMNCFLQHNAKYQKASRYEKAIIDQGNFQNIVSVFEKKMSASNLKNYLKFLVQPDILFIFFASSDKLAQRVADRKYFTREDFKEDKRQNWFGAAKDNDELFRGLAKTLSILCVFVDANQSQETSKNLILSYIR